MDNKLSELSKPVAWEVKGILCHSEEEARVYVGEPEPLYSQEYVSALLAELKSSQAIANEYQQLMYYMDAGGDFYEFQRDKVMKEQSNG
ncbi:TPA: hypothetical protein ACXIZC_000481 [Serratia marcescens]